MTCSLPAIMECTGGPAWGLWQKWLHDTWKCRLGLIQEREFNFYCQVWCCWGTSSEVGKWRLMSYIAVINILMVLSKTLQITLFLLYIDTLAQVIDENPVKLFNFSPLHAICLPSAPLRAPLGTVVIGWRNHCWWWESWVLISLVF